jgi:hypothetical protein
VAQEFELIDQRIFVAFLTMALATSVLSAVGIKHLLGRGHGQSKEPSDLLSCP